MQTNDRQYYCYLFDECNRLVQYVKHSLYLIRQAVVGVPDYYLLLKASTNLHATITALLGKQSVASIHSSPACCCCCCCQNPVKKEKTGSGRNKSKWVVPCRACGLGSAEYSFAAVEGEEELVASPSFRCLDVGIDTCLDVLFLFFTKNYIMLNACVLFLLGSLVDSKVIES